MLFWPANATQRTMERTMTVFMVMNNRLFCVEEKAQQVNIWRAVRSLRALNEHKDKRILPVRWMWGDAVQVVAEWSSDDSLLLCSLYTPWPGCATLVLLLLVHVKIGNCAMIYDLVFEPVSNNTRQGKTPIFSCQEWGVSTPGQLLPQVESCSRVRIKSYVKWTELLQQYLQWWCFIVLFRKMQGKVH